MGFVEKKLKAQSALEYVITYGWAILIITIVLAVLYVTIVSSTGNLGGKLPAGSCHVIRPNGPGTTSQIGKTGECTGLPQDVASFSGSGGIRIPITWSSGSETQTAWVYVSALPATTQYITQQYASIGGFSINSDGSVSFDVCNLVCIQPEKVTTAPGAITPGKWYFIAGNYSATTLNGPASLNVCVSSGASLTCTSAAESTQLNPSTNHYHIGSTVNYGSAFVGNISNVQVYTAGLSYNGLLAQYQQGIGGAPLDLNDLFAWYPLNGNGNDYSGNGYNGTSLGVSYTSTWKGYSAP